MHRNQLLILQHLHLQLLCLSEKCCVRYFNLVSKKHPTDQKTSWLKHSRVTGIFVWTCPLATAEIDPLYTPQLHIQKWRTSSAVWQWSLYFRCNGKSTHLFAFCFVLLLFHQTLLCTSRQRQYHCIITQFLSKMKPKPIRDKISCLLSWHSTSFNSITVPGLVSPNQFWK